MTANRIDPYSLIILDVPKIWSLDGIYDDLINNYGDGIADVKRMFNKDGIPVKSVRVEFHSSDQVQDLLESGQIILSGQTKDVKEYFLPMICFVCEGIGHPSRNCPNVDPCSKCHKRHYINQTTCSPMSQPINENHKPNAKAPIKVNRSSTPTSTASENSTMNNVASSVNVSTPLNNIEALIRAQTAKYEQMIDDLEVRLTTRISHIETQLKNCGRITNP
ncbi:unnamed protein product [Didymodactylos carnosus]|uniref:CCHC-type domain-containing protein n=1 Tax=Didymodactylos carnosus TaxID=1234261 RepID=A0A8S2DHF4_9BILA|nr:unnamed protein product [Didymodactylos carnosus]CAF3739458.1 unnamed protein product [Didymodactylos carnosus]